MKVACAPLFEYDSAMLKSGSLEDLSAIRRIQNVDGEDQHVAPPSGGVRWFHLPPHAS